MRGFSTLWTSMILMRLQEGVSVLTGDPVQQVAEEVSGGSHWVNGGAVGGDSGGDGDGLDSPRRGGREAW